jgi:hypothetical protein
MTYTVTGLADAPDASVSCRSRHTAQGALDLATAFKASGLREVEVRDGNGNICHMRELADVDGLSDGGERPGRG